MIEAEVSVDRNIWIKAQRVGLRYSAFVDQMRFYGWRLFFIWGVVAAVDGINNQQSLISYHIQAFFLLWLFACIAGYIHWYLEVGKKSVSFSFDVKLDENGVTAIHPEVLVPWSSYKSIKEYDDFYLIRSDSGISVLPKNESIHDVIDYSKQKIPNKRPQVDQRK
jgi:hypothetical protein